MAFRARKVYGTFEKRTACGKGNGKKMCDAQGSEVTPDARAKTPSFPSSSFLFVLSLFLFVCVELYEGNACSNACSNACCSAYSAVQCSAVQ